VLASLPVNLFLHRVDEENEGKNEGEVERTVTPLLEDAEARRVDVKDRQDDRHGKDQLCRDPRETTEPHLRVVLGDLLHVVLEFGG